MNKNSAEKCLSILFPVRGVGGGQPCEVLPNGVKVGLGEETLSLD